MVDPMLGGHTAELDPLKTTAADLSRLKEGGITDRHRPETVTTHKYAAQPEYNQAQVRQAPSVNREMVIIGYKGKADAWLRCLKEVLAVNGQQLDRKFYLGLDPREMNRQAELMEAGSQAFSTFVVIPYRDPLADQPIGLPAARNLHALVGTVTEEYRNVGPTLIVLPFHTLQPGTFDTISRHYEHAKQTRGIAFLGYKTKQASGEMPGAAIVLPPQWARHPDFPLAKGLNQYVTGDISFLKDEILRAMRSSDCMIGHGQKPGPSTSIQTFAADEIIDQPTQGYNPNGKSVPAQQAPIRPTHPEPTPLPPKPQAAIPVEFTQEEKEAALALISQLGMGALKVLDPVRYGITLASDEKFANDAQNKAQGFKIRQGKKKKSDV